MKKTVLAFMALLTCSCGLLTACGDDGNDNEYAIDIEQLATQLPGTWTVDDVTIQSLAGRGNDRTSLADGVPLSGRVEFGSNTFQVYDAYGQHFDRGTYKVGRYYIAFARENGDRDTLQIANVDRTAYQSLKLRYPQDKSTNIYFDLVKVLR